MAQIEVSTTNQHLQTNPISQEKQQYLDDAKDNALQKLKPNYMVTLWNAIKSTFVALKNYYTADKSTNEKKEQETSIYNNEIKKRNEQFKLAFQKNFLLENAENQLNLKGLNYTKEDLEEIFRNERNSFHPDKYTSQAQKRACAKTFAQIAESYEIIMLLKNWN